MYVLNVNIVNMKNICIRLYVFKKKTRGLKYISIDQPKIYQIL
jgi:hypothetical protein